MSPDEPLADLPPALLLLGPGAWDAGLAAWEHNRSFFSTKVEHLDAASARHVVEQAGVKPFGRALKVILINLDGAAEAAQNMLLKVLEEPPPSVRFLLSATMPPLDTVVSRCRVLTQAEGSPAGTGPEQDKAREAVGIALRAARDGHVGVLEAVMRNWDADATVQLRAWAAERAADRWIGFEAGWVGGITARQAMTILSVLGQYDGARTAAAVALHRAFQA